MKTDIHHLGGNELWPWAPALLVVAVLAKGGGSAAAARLTGQGGRGALMNCRGLTELAVLGVGLRFGVIAPGLFTLLVVMALLTTTAMTSPLLSRLHGCAPPVLRATDGAVEKSLSVPAQHPSATKEPGHTTRSRKRTDRSSTN